MSNIIEELEKIHKVACYDFDSINFLSIKDIINLRQETAKKIINNNSNIDSNILMQHYEYCNTVIKKFLGL